MKTSLINQILGMIITAFLRFVAAVKFCLVPEKETVKGPMTFVKSKVRTIAFSAKAWMYAFFAQLRADSYSLA